jgi:hypothetical protein
MGFTMMIVFGILAGWLLLSVVVCVAVGVAIRQADAREAVPVAQSARPSSRRRRGLSVA